MHHAWSLFALHKCISLEEYLPELGVLLGSTLDLNMSEIDLHCKRIDLKQLLTEGVNQFVAFANTEMQIPMVLCYTGDTQAIMLFTSWLKAQGVIVWPLELSSSAMIAIADTMVAKNYYDAKFVFDVVTHRKNLKKIEIEVDKQSFRALAGEKDAPLQESIIPYIHDRSGIVVGKLPLVLIAFAGFATVGMHVIQTSAWSSEHLRKLLQCIQ